MWQGRKDKRGAGGGWRLAAGEGCRGGGRRKEEKASVVVGHWESKVWRNSNRPRCSSGSFRLSPARMSPQFARELRISPAAAGLRVEAEPSARRVERQGRKGATKGRRRRFVMAFPPLSLSRRGRFSSAAHLFLEQDRAELCAALEDVRDALFCDWRRHAGGGAASERQGGRQREGGTEENRGKVAPATTWPQGKQRALLPPAAAENIETVGRRGWEKALAGARGGGEMARRGARQRNRQSPASDD